MSVNKLDYHTKKSLARTLVKENWEQLCLIYGRGIKIRYSGTDRDGHYLWLTQDQKWIFVYISPTGFVAHIKKPRLGRKYCRAIGCCEDLTPTKKINKTLNIKVAA